MSDLPAVVSGTLNFQPTPAPAIKFPAIPDTGTTTDELRATVDALKEAVELLSGVNANGVAQAITPIQMASLMGTTTTSVRDAVGNWGVFDTLQGQVGVVRKALIATKVELTASVNDLIAAYLAGDKRLAGTITTLSHSVSGNAAAITHEEIVRSTEDTALATAITSVMAIASSQRTFTSPTAPSYTPPDAARMGDIWIDTAHSNLLKVWDGHAWTAYDDGRIGVNATNITSEATARATADTAMGTRVDTLTTRVGTAESAITAESTARTTADTAIAGTVTDITTKLGGAPGDVSQFAAIHTEYLARTSLEGSVSILSGTVTTNNNHATAGGYYRLASTTPTSGDAAAEFAMQVSATNNGTGWGTAGIVLQAMGSGASRVKINSSQFIVDNGVAPFSIIGGELRFGGKIYGSDIVAGTVSANQITANTITTNQITAGGVDVVALAQNAATKIDVTQTSLGSITLDGSDHLIAQLSVTSIGSNYFVIASVDIAQEWGDIVALNPTYSPNLDLDLQLRVDGGIVRTIAVPPIPASQSYSAATPGGTLYHLAWRTKGHFEVMWGGFLSGTVANPVGHTIQIVGNNGAYGRRDSTVASVGSLPTIVAIELRR